MWGHIHAVCFMQITGVQSSIFHFLPGQHPLSLGRNTGSRAGQEGSLSIFLLTAAVRLQPFNISIRQLVGLAVTDASNKQIFLSNSLALHLQ